MALQMKLESKPQPLPQHTSSHNSAMSHSRPPWASHSRVASCRLAWCVSTTPGTSAVPGHTDLRHTPGELAQHRMAAVSVAVSAHLTSGDICCWPVKQPSTTNCMAAGGAAGGA